MTAYLLLWRTNESGHISDNDIDFRTLRQSNVYKRPSNGDVRCKARTFWPSIGRALNRAAFNRNTHVTHSEGRVSMLSMEYKRKLEPAHTQLKTTQRPLPRTRTPTRPTPLLPLARVDGVGSVRQRARAARHRLPSASMGGCGEPQSAANMAILILNTKMMTSQYSSSLRASKTVMLGKF